MEAKMPFNGARVCDVTRRGRLRRRSGMSHTRRLGEVRVAASLTCGLARAPLGKSRAADFA